LNQRTRLIVDSLLLIGLCCFLFFFGLGHFGLVGADEPRYAQIAREMLARHDWITPTLGGKPWLEKPVLYYWQAMIAYSIFGVSDWVARLPSAFDATLMVWGVYLFLSRIGSKTEYAGFPLDGALFMASAAGVIGFAHAASTDMPLAATFTLGMLAWYAWRESGTKSYLALFYFFIGLGTLAKGPVAPFLAAAIIAIFTVATHDWKIIRRTPWLPGILLFCLVTLPWYIAVQHRNSEFFHVFILEHNLARFGTNLYHHTEPFWYYIPVVLLGLMPWIIFIVLAFIESVRTWISRSQILPPEDVLNMFLLIWLMLPIFFFSISKSKLPGYILPALPAGTLLLADYVRRKVTFIERPRNLETALHSIVSALPVVPALMIQYVLVQHRLPWGRALLISCLIALGLAIAIGATLKKYGLRMLRTTTLIPVVLALAFVVRFGSPALDETLSARPLANDLIRVENSFAEKPPPIAVLRLSREDEYGLHFYLDTPILRYELGEVPAQEHIVVVPRELQERVMKRAAGRQVVHLGTFAPRALEYFWVSSP